MKPQSPAGGAESHSPGRLLITAGPTHEPIDAVRFIGNRSSGRLGVALAEEAAREGWTVTLLLGPTPVQPSDSRVEVRRFRTTADLQTLLMEALPGCDVLVMAAAVADYKPKATAQMLKGKHRRVEGGMVIELESTPDLLAGCGKVRRSDQVLVGFALEPREELEASARRKLAKKRVDLIVANPLETMDAATVEAKVFGREGTGLEGGRATQGAIPKERFAEWLLGVIGKVRDRVRERVQVSNHLKAPETGIENVTGQQAGQSARAPRKGSQHART